MARIKQTPEEARQLAQAWLSENGPDRKPTINDVAALAKVSKKTISRVINQSPSVKDDTRDTVTAVIETLGYVPNPQARGLAFNHSFLLGMIYDNPNPQYVVNMQRGILDQLRATAYDLVIHPCDRDDPNYIEDALTFIERQRLFGVILTPSISEDERLARALAEAKCNYTRIASVALEASDRMIVSNDRIGAAQAMSHLCQLGHKRIAFVTGRRGFMSTLERQKGCEEALAEAGLKLDPKYVVVGNYTFESGLTAAQELLGRSPRPTAIFAANDEMAAGVLQALRVHKVRVPEEMSVVGYDDFEISRTVWPRLTTVHTPTREVGQRAALRVMSPAGATVDAEDLTPWLVVRESSGPCPEP